MYSWTSTAVPRPIVVAIAAPWMPSSGNGPSPKIRSGSRTMFRPFASHSTRIAIAASPAPRKAAFCRKRSTITMFDPKSTFV